MVPAWWSCGGRYLALAVCIAGVLLILAGCGRRAARQTSAKPASDTLAPSEGLVLEASCTPTRVGRDVELAVDVRILNAGRSPIVLRRLLDPASTLALTFRDAQGRRLPSRGMTKQLMSAARADEFVKLSPGHMYGVRLTLTPGKEAGRERYSVQSLPDLAIDERHFLHAPGRYSLTAGYAGLDDGGSAGVKAWTGRLSSQPVTFELPVPGD